MAVVVEEVQPQEVVAMLLVEQVILLQLHQAKEIMEV